MNTDQSLVERAREIQTGKHWKSCAKPAPYTHYGPCECDIEAIFKALQAVQDEERERCAKVAEDCPNCFEPEYCVCSSSIAKAIRERKE